MFSIHIRDLSVRCIIGIFPREREIEQEVLLNLTLRCEAPDAAETDRVEDTVDYKKVNKAVYELVRQSRFCLLEALADRVAALCLAEPRVVGVRVVVDKPGALRHARSVAVELERSR